MTRHFWVLVHRYAGLYMAFFLIVAGATGSILAFSQEIVRALVPTLVVAAQDQPMLDGFELRRRALALIPEQGKLEGVSLHRAPTDAFIAAIEPRLDADGKPYVLPFNFLLLNPYTGAEIERIPYDGAIWPITRLNFTSFITSLHFRLAIPGSIGTWLFGIAALIWTLDCFVSAYLTFPVSIQRTPRTDSSTTDAVRRSWWSRWKPAWWVKWRGSAYRINFDLHRAGGLWVWLMLLVLAWSSVGFNLNQEIYVPVMKTVFGMRDVNSEIPDLKTPRTTPALDLEQAYGVGQSLMTQQAATHHFVVRHAEGLYYNAAKGVYYYSVRSDRDLNDMGGGTTITFDGDSGKFLGLSLPTGQNAGTTINSWIFTLHTAMIWGLPFKIFVSLVGILIVMLSVTGVIIWLKKRRARRSGSQRQSVASA
jgi:uncharacterized iron-regulated membrane protein